MRSFEHELHCWLVGLAFKDAKGFRRPVEFPIRHIPAEATRVAQPLRLCQIGLAALQLSGPFRHLNFEFVAGFAKLSLALPNCFIRAGGTKRRCGMICRYGEQQLINFAGKGGVIARRRNQASLGTNADRNDNTAALLRAGANVADDLAARQAAVDGEMRLQPFRECSPCAPPSDFHRRTPARITQTHKGEVEVQ